MLRQMNDIWNCSNIISFNETVFNFKSFDQIFLLGISFAIPPPIIYVRLDPYQNTF